jgi:hypothetical protein
LPAVPYFVLLIGDNEFPLRSARSILFHFVSALYFLVLARFVLTHWSPRSICCNVCPGFSWLGTLTVLKFHEDFHVGSSSDIKNGEFCEVFNVHSWWVFRQQMLKLLKFWDKPAVLNIAEILGQVGGLEHYWKALILELTLRFFHGVAQVLSLFVLLC